MASSERIFTLLDTAGGHHGARGAGWPRVHAGARPHRVRPRLVRLRERRCPGAARTSRSRSRRASASGIVGRDRRRQVHHHQPADALLRRRHAARSGSTASDVREHGARATCARLFSLVLQDVQLFAGTIGDNVRLGQPRHHRRGHPPRGRGRARRPLHRPAAARAREPGGRAGRHALGGAETAPLVRAGAGLQSADPGPRRGHLQRRYRDRAPDPGRAARC